MCICYFITLNHNISYNIYESTIAYLKNDNLTSE